MSRYLFVIALLPAFLLATGCADTKPQFDEPAVNRPLPQDPPGGGESLSHLTTAPGAPLELEDHGEVTVDGQTVPLRRATKQDLGLMVPDGEGGMIWIPADKERPEADPNYIEARELKLKIRELCDQLISNINQAGLYGAVALPTSFVNQDDFEQTSSFGRYVAEQMFYEFNQRGFPAREYRLTGNIAVVGGRDDLALIENAVIPAGQKWAALVVGTYYVDKDATFVNARLVRATDGLVMRTGQLVLVNTPIVARMGKTDPPAVKPAPAQSGSSSVASASKPSGQRGGLYPSLYTPASSITSGSINIKQGK